MFVALNGLQSHDRGVEHLLYDTLSFLESTYIDRAIEWLWLNNRNFVSQMTSQSIYFC